MSRVPLLLSFSKPFRIGIRPVLANCVLHPVLGLLIPFLGVYAFGMYPRG
jgi:hypothetical protein